MDACNIIKLRPDLLLGMIKYIIVNQRSRIHTSCQPIAPGSFGLCWSMAALVFVVQPAPGNCSGPLRGFSVGYEELGNCTHEGVPERLAILVVGHKGAQLC